jgi:hypothetical protein
VLLRRTQERRPLDWHCSILIKHNDKSAAVGSGA